MVDPFLAIHLVRPGVFELSGLRTTSVRDQIQRGQLLATRCNDEGFFDESLPLLVIGGGAAGVAVAKTAARLGIQVVLYEKNGTQYFARQRGCDRWICPTVCDWPARHWEKATFPWAPDPKSKIEAAHGGPSTKMPLTYVAEKASNIAMSWDTQIQNWVANDPTASNVKTRPSLFDPKWLRSVGLSLQLSDPAIGKVELFGAAVSCVGFGEEDCSRNPASPYAGARFQGHPFWGKDKLGSPSLGSTQTGTKRVLVAGGGDGALQDFVRALVGHSNMAVIYRSIFPTAGDEPPYSDLLHGEDAARRAYCWQPSGSKQHETLHHWHEVFVHVVTETLAANAAAFKQRAAALLRSDVEATLVHGCDHFDHSYSINRVLAIAVAQLHAWQRGIGLSEVLVPFTSIRGMRPNDATKSYGTTPALCDGIEHYVEFDDRACPNVVIQPPPARPQPNCDVAVIRYGIKPGSRTAFGNAQVPDQMVPFWIDR